MAGGANLPLVSTYNRNVVLDAIRSVHDLSRVELAAMTGLTGATVSNIVRRLIDDGYVYEVGQGVSTGGKPRTMLRINRTGAYAVGVAIDDGSATSVLTDLMGVPLARRRSAAGQHSKPSTVIAHVARDVLALVEEAEIDASRVVGGHERGRCRRRHARSDRPQPRGRAEPAEHGSVAQRGPAHRIGATAPPLADPGGQRRNGGCDGRTMGRKCLVRRQFRQFAQ